MSVLRGKFLVAQTSGDSSWDPASGATSWTQKFRPQSPLSGCDWRWGFLKTVCCKTLTFSVTSAYSDWHQVMTSTEVVRLKECQSLRGHHSEQTVIHYCFHHIRKRADNFVLPMWLLDRNMSLTSDRKWEVKLRSFCSSLWSFWL